jgi:hypothetical protein
MSIEMRAFSYDTNNLDEPHYTDLARLAELVREGWQVFTQPVVHTVKEGRTTQVQMLLIRRT